MMFGEDISIPDFKGVFPLIIFRDNLQGGGVCV